MERSEFLKKVGLGAAFALTVTCLGGCATENVAPDTNGPVDFTLDLNEAANSRLSNNGGFIVVDGSVVVGRANDGSYVAATRTCSHEPRKEVRLRNGEWYCTVHGARFNLDGSGLNGNGRNGLKIYNTEVNGNMLRVFS